MALQRAPFDLVRKAHVLRSILEVVLFIYFFVCTKYCRFIFSPCGRLKQSFEILGNTQTLTRTLRHVCVWEMNVGEQEVPRWWWWHQTFAAQQEFAGFFLSKAQNLEEEEEEGGGEQRAASRKAERASSHMHASRN